MFLIEIYLQITLRFTNEKSYPVTGGELDTARILLDNLLHLLPCSCQSDLKHVKKYLLKCYTKVLTLKKNLLFPLY